jgi:hypothetical protein
MEVSDMRRFNGLHQQTIGPTWRGWFKLDEVPSGVHHPCVLGEPNFLCNLAKRLHLLAFELTMDNDLEADRNRVRWYNL